MAAENVWRFTKEEKDQVKEWLATKAKNAHCPFCENGAFHIGEYGVVLTSGPPVLSGTATGYPFVPIVCTTCGCTQFLNTMAMGLRPVPKAEGHDDE